MTGSPVLSSSAGIYYPLPQKGRSAQRPARGVQPPSLLGDLHSHPSPLAEIALQYNHRHNPRQQQQHIAVARDRASPVNCPRSGARCGGGDGRQGYSPPVLLYELAQEQTIRSRNHQFVALIIRGPASVRGESTPSTHTVVYPMPDAGNIRVL